MAEIAYSAAAVQSSRLFRVLLDAMAKPGHVFEFASKIHAIEPAFATTLAIAQTLFDFQTPLWLAPEFNTDAIKPHLKFHTGAPIVEGLSGASFAILSAKTQLPLLRQFEQGTHEYPDRSTTVIIQVDNFDKDAVMLSGPGLKQPVGFGVQGLSEQFWLDMMVNHHSYPLGVDVIFASSHAIACCPRSTCITLKESA